MFTKAFPGMLAGTAAGNPAFVAGPVNWSAALISHHLVVLNAIFAAVQVALGLGIAWRPRSGWRWPPGAPPAARSPWPSPWATC
jgi:hypothetical protein